MLLRSTLLINGICTGLVGLALLLAPAPLATLLGIPTPNPLAAVGAGLVLYAGGLFWTSRILTSLGAGLVALVAVAVFVFGALQFVGVRRLANAA